MHIKFELERVYHKNFLNAVKIMKLYSVDIDDCSNVSTDINWTFLKSRDDDFKYLEVNYQVCLT